MLLVGAPTAEATRIWGRIVGLGSWQTSNYIESVKIQTDRGENYTGKVRYLAGPGLIWEASVPSNQNRSYTVTVRVSGTAAEKVRWNPEKGYGYFVWGWLSFQATDVTFWLKE
jgi:hypothetical protein